MINTSRDMSKAPPPPPKDLTEANDDVLKVSDNVI